MSEINVTALDPGWYGVAVTEGYDTTNHRVLVTQDFLDDLELFDVDPALVVREAFRFLLDREPADGIEGDFRIDQIARDHPDFYGELRTRLGATP